MLRSFSAGVLGLRGGQKNRFGLKALKSNVQQVRALQGLVVGVPKESFEGEERVALTPVHVTKLKKAGAHVKIEKNAGLGSGFTDAEYSAAGADIVNNGEAFKCQVVAKIRPPSSQEASLIENRNLMSIVQPRQNTDLMDQLMKQKATVFSMDSLLRTLSRGQSFDVLSSQANIAGYRAVIEAGKYLTMLLMCSICLFIY